MRLGGAPSGGETPLAMGTGNDYAELCDLGPSRWSSSSRGVGGSGVGGGIGGVTGVTGSAYAPASAIYQPSSTASTSRIRSNSFEAEDAVGPYGGSTRIGNSTSSLRGRTGLYYSPPGTSYTIVERERDRPLSPHYYYNTAGAPPKGGSLPNRSSYLESASLGGGSLTNSARHNGKKRPISPEQVLRMFNTTTSSQSVPTNYHSSNGTRDRGRRSPASSPPSTTHQVSSGLCSPFTSFTHPLFISIFPPTTHHRPQIYHRDRERDRSIPNIHHQLTTRTVTMSRDQQPDGSHGFGICVKGGKESGNAIFSIYLVFLLFSFLSLFTFACLCIFLPFMHICK